MSIMLHDLSYIISVAVAKCIPLYRTHVSTRNMEQKLKALSTFFLSNTICYIHSLRTTNTNYYRRYAALDTYLDGFTDVFVQTFLVDKSQDDPVDTYLRKDGAAALIQSAYKRSICDPSYKMCRHRLQREYLDLAPKN